MRPEFYPIYKGLQKPLVYRGFKGKFIYLGIGSLAGGLVLGGVIGALTNLYLGGFFTLTIMGAGLYYVLKKQQAGLYEKTRFNGVLVFPNQLSIQYEKRT